MGWYHVHLSYLCELEQLGSSLRKRSKAPPKPAPPEPRINERIRVPEVRLIDENGAQVGVVRTSEAITMARQRDVDLVEVAAGANPPVARLMDFGRFKYEQSKKDREAKKHQQNVQLREVRMKPKIDEHDIDFKTRTAAKLLKRGDKVKVTVTFRGREITHPQVGKGLIDRIVGSLDDIAMVEKDAMLEGRHMTIILAPDKKKIAAKARAAAAAADGAAPVEIDEDDAELEAAVAAARLVNEDDHDEDDDSDDDEEDTEEATSGVSAGATGD
jgi:translation initiation factor IF-3